jgi:hypothetical protein
MGWDGEDGQSLAQRGWLVHTRREGIGGLQMWTRCAAVLLGLWTQRELWIRVPHSACG